MPDQHRHSENGHRYIHDHSGFESDGEREAHLYVRHGAARATASVPAEGRVHIINGQPCDDPTCHRAHGLAGT